MFALVDGKNFYASCEQFFQPELRGKPLVVLSNKVGCAIARSAEAKALGIKMGHPAYEFWSGKSFGRGDKQQRVISTETQIPP